VWSSLLPKENMPSLVDGINRQETQGGRMAQKQLGALREDSSEDMRLLTENYTVPSLASALRDREELLQQCAELCKKKKFEQVTALLQPFQHEHIQRRRDKKGKLALDRELNASSLEMLRKALMRMPRRVVYAHQKRAGVVLGLANVAGIPSVLLEKRAAHLRAHPEEVCLPGGMVCSVADDTIMSTCLREMHEEIGGLTENITVLGVLRCNWGEVHHLVGVAVTPLVCFLGDLTDSTLVPNPDEVAEVFTIPLSTLIQRDYWIHREGFAPIFLGGPHAIWGLTGYILERFVKDILSHHRAGMP
jgi:8-oxo-dGTP pyrophosphatase MutT (NUDIX family)